MTNDACKRAYMHDIAMCYTHIALPTFATASRQVNVLCTAHLRQRLLYVLRSLSTIAGRRLLVDGVHHGDEIRPTALGVVRRDYAKPMHKLTVVYVSNHLGKQDFLGQRVHTYCACG